MAQSPCLEGALLTASTHGDVLCLPLSDEFPLAHLLQPFRQYYLQAEHSLPALIQIRSEGQLLLSLFLECGKLLMKCFLLLRSIAVSFLKVPFGCAVLSSFKGATCTFKVLINSWKSVSPFEQVEKL